MTELQTKKTDDVSDTEAITDEIAIALTLDALKNKTNVLSENGHEENSSLPDINPESSEPESSDKPAPPAEDTLSADKKERRLPISRVSGSKRNEDKNASQKKKKKRNRSPNDRRNNEVAFKLAVPAFICGCFGLIIPAYILSIMAAIYAGNAKRMGHHDSRTSATGILIFFAIVLGTLIFIFIVTKAGELVTLLEHILKNEPIGKDGVLPLNIT